MYFWGLLEILAIVVECILISLMKMIFLLLLFMESAVSADYVVDVRVDHAIKLSLTYRILKGKRLERFRTCGLGV